MNHIYRVVWNNALQLWQCVSELAHAHSAKSCKNCSEISSLITPPQQQLN